MRRLDRLATHSDDPDRLTRTYLGAAQKKAHEDVLGWMREAGMTARLDAVGNVVGRYEGAQPGAPALLLGSHLDTVRDAGRYDGMLGVIAGIECVEALGRAGKRLPFAVEVIGFADEEGVRFPVNFIGSRAVIGTLDGAALAAKDAAGTSMAEALRAAGFDPARVGQAARKPSEVLAYVELHIEQGPVLEAGGLALGVVDAIAGSTRLSVELTGEAGHAGTVPMKARRDALATAAECVLAVERRASAPGLVGTVGRIECLPGAINVIPGKVRFSVDLRSGDDGLRKAAIADVEREFAAIAARRKVGLAISTIHDGKACACSPWLMERIGRAIESQGQKRFDLPSGAGHDGMTMIGLCDIGMMFVRCKHGVSHNPAEAMTMDDAEIATRALLRLIEEFEPGSRRT